MIISYKCILRSKIIIAALPLRFSGWTMIPLRHYIIVFALIMCTTGSQENLKQQQNNATTIRTKSTKQNNNTTPFLSSNVSEEDSIDFEHPYSKQFFCSRFQIHPSNCSCDVTPFVCQVNLLEAFIEQQNDTTMFLRAPRYTLCSLEHPGIHYVP